MRFLSFNVPREVVIPILRVIHDRLGVPLDGDFAIVNFQKTEDMNRAIAAEGKIVDGVDVAVLGKGPHFPAYRFILTCIEVGLKAFQMSSSVEQSSGDFGVTPSIQQIKSRLVFNLFNRSHSDCIFPRGMPAEVVTSWTMVMLAVLPGFESEVWKKTKDERLTLRWFAEKIVDITIEECNSGSSKWE